MLVLIDKYLFYTNNNQPDFSVKVNSGIALTIAIALSSKKIFSILTQ